MKPIIARIFLFAAIPAAAGLLFADPGPRQLFYTSPATFAADVTSNEALPIGNGKQAAMIYGGVGTEIIQFNEDTIWAGRIHDYSHAGASNYLSQIRNHIWNGNGDAAWTVASPNFMSVPLRQSPYQPAGELRLTFPHSGTQNYSRTLDLETATAEVRYNYGGTQYTREVFASYPDKVIVIRLTADRPGMLTFSCAFATPHTRSTNSISGNDLILSATVNNDPDSRRQQISQVRFQARVRVLADGGTVSSGTGSVSVSNADAVTLIFHVASNFVRYNDLSADPATRALAAISAAAAKGYSDLRADHLADYQSLFNRVALDLGTSSSADLPIPQRLDNLNAAIDTFKGVWGWGDPAEFTQHFAGDDLQLIALNFQMARYLLISGSRPGSQPLNLQGKWNNELNPAWESKMTLNINQEMNYWAAETVNLPECHQPMVELARDLAESGAAVARAHYGARGWMVHHNTDVWRGAAPINNAGGLWPSGGAWLSMHLWWRYLYSGDTNDLADIYPLMKGAAEFFVDFLVPDPRSGNAPWLLTNPSHSPEHPNPATDDELVAGPTMDIQLIRALFTYVIDASELLNIDSSFRASLVALRDQLPPNRIGRHGQLQEWLEDVDEPENPAIGGHRHLSHLVDLFPGEAIDPFHEPALAAAARVPLDWKGDPSNNTSWSRAWKMCLRNALLQGDHAYMILNDLLAKSHTDSLTFSQKGNENQIDGNFGALMGTVQFFIQNRRGEIHLLPALPSRIPQGSISGLRCPGGFEVGLTWQSNRLVAAALHSKLGNTCRLRSRWPVSVKLGDSFVDAPMIRPGLWQFSTIAGSNYTILPANLHETEFLSYLASPGRSHVTISNSMFSNGRSMRFNAAAPGDFVTYVLPQLAEGTYQIRVVADAGLDRGRFQLAAGPAGGALTNIGPVQDTYSATNFITLYSTNMLKELDCGTLDAGAAGSYEFKFTVTGKDAASSGYALVLDYIKLTPVTPAAGPSPALTAAILNGQLVLSWPASATGFSLEQAGSLTAPVWSLVTSAPVEEGGLMVLTLDLDTVQAFYRLKRP